MMRILYLLQLLVTTWSYPHHDPTERFYQVDYPYSGTNYVQPIRSYNAFLSPYYPTSVHDPVLTRHVTIPEVMPTLNVLAELPYAVSNQISILPMILISKDTINMIQDGQIMDISKEKAEMTVKVGSNATIHCTPAVRLILEKPIVVNSLKSDVLFPSEVQIIHEQQTIPIRIGAVLAPVLPDTYVSQEAPIAIRVVYAVPTKPIKITITINQEQDPASQILNEKPAFQSEILPLELPVPNKQTEFYVKPSNTVQVPTALSYDGTTPISNEKKPFNPFHPFNTLPEGFYDDSSQVMPQEIANRQPDFGNGPDKEIPQITQTQPLTHSVKPNPSNNSNNSLLSSSSNTESDAEVKEKTPENISSTNKTDNGDVVVVGDPESEMLEREPDLPPKNVTVIDFPEKEAEPVLQIDEEDEELVNRNPPIALAPAGIVQSTQPHSHVEPFHNDKESPLLEAMREESKKRI